MRQLFKTGVLQLFCLQLLALPLYYFFQKTLELYACVDRDTTIVCLEFNWIFN